MSTQAELRQLIREGHVANSNFANSIANTMRISDKQQFWIDKLVTEGQARRDNKQEKPAATLVLEPLANFFSQAANHLKYPKIQLRHQSKTVLIKRAGTRSKHAGSLFINDGTGFGGKYYGKIDTTGGVFLTKDGEQMDLLPLLTALANNPAEIAAEHGRLTGNCCFCLKELTDERSTSVGYGPICADHWGLPWGTVQINES